MDTKWKKYSHSSITKTIAFILAIACFTIAITVFMNIVGMHRADFHVISEDSYFNNRDYMEESNEIVRSLTKLIVNYKNEEHILNGGSLSEKELERREQYLFWEFLNSKYHNSNVDEQEKYQIFIDVYAEKLSQLKDKMIKEEIVSYNATLQKLAEYQGLMYYASDGDNTFTNSTNSSKEYFQRFPSYMIFDDYERIVYPQEVSKNKQFHWLGPTIYTIEESNSTLFVAFTDEFLNPRIEEWQTNKLVITDGVHILIGSLMGLVVTLIFLIVVIGRRPEDDEVHLHFVDKIYTDINIVMCLLLIASWVATMNFVYFQNELYQIVFPSTLIIGALGLILVLSLVKHIKNKTIFEHSVIYSIFHKFFRFIREIFDNGSIAVKAILIVIGYPALVAITFFMFPITIGVAAWLSLKKVKEFKAIQEGVERVKGGELKHIIDVTGNGEFGKLAANINSITDGLDNAVANELKSERLKTELITNVSHDIRTPLTSIITYVDLLKKEKHETKCQEYIEIIDQKSQRLIALTDDLFEASKASSGSIPVNYEKIDLIALLTQGLGEVDNKITERELEFKVNYPSDKVIITADGKLLWRAIENLLSNVFNYALSGSRVYVVVQELDNEVMLVIKNISDYELNISSDELMERFKRGDESRSSQGSGLGLSIAKSLIEIQKGNFKIEIDGDLFKAIIKMPK